MKRPGHYFCDHCDEVAYGRICRGCHNEARFIPDDPPRAEVGAEWFARMRVAVDAAPAPQ